MRKGKKEKKKKRKKKSFLTKDFQINLLFKTNDRKS